MLTRALHQYIHQCCYANHNVNYNAALQPADANPNLGVIILAATGGLFAMYLSLGIAYNKKIKHMDGTDVVPNKEFWTGLPHLVKEGMLFTFKQAVATKVKWATVDKYEVL